MNKYISLALALMPLAFSACKDDDVKSETPVDRVETVLDVKTDTIFFSRVGGKVVLPVSANTDGDVDVSCDAKWLSLATADEGVAISASRNEAYEPRKATLFVSKDSAEVSIVVYQNATDLLSPDKDTRIKYVDQAYEPDYEGGSIFVNFEANGNYSVKKPWWIKLDKSERKPAVDGVFSVKEKYTFLTNYDVAREGRIEFSLGDTSFVCVLKQGKTEFDFSKVSRSAKEVAASMNFGVNLAGLYNDAVAGSVSPAALSALADSSVNVVRIPCSWYSNSKGELAAHVQQWASRVRTTVDAALAVGQNVIINLDDAGQWDAFASADTANLFNLYAEIWTMLSAEFAGYGDNLIFEAYGSMPMEGVSPSALQTDIADRLNELFIQSVRRSGALNYKRTLIIPTYAQEIDCADYLTLPKDYTDNRLIVGFQYFKPEGYAKKRAFSFWGKPYAEAANFCADHNEEDLAKAFGKIAKKFTVPILLTSFGVNVHSPEADDAMAACEEYYVFSVAKAAHDAGIVPFLLDDGARGLGSFGFLGRASEPIVDRGSYFTSFKNGALGKSQIK